MKKRIGILICVIIMVFSSISFAFAAGADPNITIVNPPQNVTVSSNSLLVSVKIAGYKALRINVYKENVYVQNGRKTVQWNTVFASGKFWTSSNLSFYTKKLVNVSPGSYIIKAYTLDGNDRIIYETTRRVSVKPRGATGNVFPSSGNGAVNNFLQGLLVSIFGN